MQKIKLVLLLSLLLVGLMRASAVIPLPTKPAPQNGITSMNDVFVPCQKEVGKKAKRCYTETLLEQGLAHPEQIKPMLTYLEEGTHNHGSNIPLLHDAVHELGMELYYTFNDPHKAFSYCNGAFNAGCYHSVVMTYFDESPNAFLFADAVAFCKNLQQRSNFSSYEYAHCIHAIGHVTIAKLKGNLTESLTLCEKTGYQTTVPCYEGVFMEYSKGQTTTGHHSHLQSGAVTLPCASLLEKHKPNCYKAIGRYSPSFVHVKGNVQKKYKEAGKLCTDIEPHYISTCMLGVTQALLNYTVNDITLANRMCIGFGDLKDLCKRTLVINKVYQFDAPPDRHLCSKFPNDMRDECITGIFTYYALTL